MEILVIKDTLEFHITVMAGARISAPASTKIETRRNTVDYWEFHIDVRKIYDHTAGLRVNSKMVFFIAAGFIVLQRFVYNRHGRSKSKLVHGCYRKS